MTDRERSDK